VRKLTPDVRTLTSVVNCNEDDPIHATQSGQPLPRMMRVFAPTSFCFYLLILVQFPDILIVEISLYIIFSNTESILSDISNLNYYILYVENNISCII
jgi:hypothetical protein